VLGILMYLLLELQSSYINKSPDPMFEEQGLVPGSKEPK
jgi:hypothetical protein